ncbi:uncharacterized protein ASCRUDRAFT_69074 [Ascoidea rubescens DSM 1968]|uniref:Uncharacterized protein n=1 Tax=Ascoidea rubescens DSM 1968 TaxID=1344418 RepID=A0A1D2VKW4_9ASCO|nr:hypothetical protein ASCRUDRAFT_69074 [Ascoidea rubescens DSM 1968]ODV62254.1 hypothetical protein ASCRUDRAFT_69074 [Ascoidea rubescens DSM 1968]
MDLSQINTTAIDATYILNIESQSRIGRQSSNKTKQNLKCNNIVVLLTNNLKEDLKFSVHGYLLGEDSHFDDVYQNYLDGRKKIELYSNSSEILRFIFSNSGIKKTG